MPLLMLRPGPTRAPRRARPRARSLRSQTRIVERLVEDLGRRGVLPEGLNTRTPLHQLAPLLVQEYILPRAPRALEVETMWAQEMDII